MSSLICANPKPSINILIIYMKAFVTKIYLTLALSFFSFQYLSAQDPVNDPLGKPDIWKLIKVDYQDTSLWASYVGTPWDQMTESTRSLILGWQAELAEFSFANGVTILAETTVEEDSESDEFWGIEEEEASSSNQMLEEIEVTAEEEQIDYLRDLKDIMLFDSPEEEDLKANINQNFFIIEDLYTEEYAALGVKYVNYETVYPNFDYDQVQWVEDKAKELKMLKEKQFNEIKINMLAGEDF
ncbi:hypothetical protein R9C00_23520 [Flammeovirgaceae bacterium SG7u.111]|nr:hypothetical protein [Flammeovirgaceae bacterium SG7u.132]WPO34675.1 hypothetical protein R9C00_23520 [Flammeovirgaceae bacterium SG7u.111]